MLRNLLSARVLVPACLVCGVMAAAPAQAWTPPGVGQACRGARAGGPAYAMIAGNYLGGRAHRQGIVDRKSFQSCFRTVDACEHWLARQAMHYPLGPNIARCTRVTLR